MGPVTALVIGDPHFKAKTASEVQTLIDGVVSLAKTHTPTFIMVLGDILHDHERIHVSPFNNAVKFLFLLKDIAPTYFIVGNHDMQNQTAFLDSTHPFAFFKGVPGLTIVDTVIHESIGGLSVMMTPYVPPGRFVEALSTHESDFRGVDVIFAHQEFYGCVYSDVESEIGDKWDPEYPLVISGHIHKRQRPQPNIIYPGTPMQHTFGESDDKGVSLFTFNNGEHTEQRFELDLPKRLLYRVTLDELESLEFNDRDYTKVIITDSYERFKAFRNSTIYRELLSKGVKVAFHNQKDSLPERESRQVSYRDMLDEIVRAESDPVVHQVYTEIFRETIE